MQGSILSVAVLLDMAAQHDLCEALLQVAAGGSTYNPCGSTRPNIHTASLTASSTRAKAKTLTIRSTPFVAQRHDIFPHKTMPNWLHSHYFHRLICLHPIRTIPDRFPLPPKTGHKTNMMLGSLMLNILYYSTRTFT